jgi:uncharacterized protein DUF4389
MTTATVPHPPTYPVHLDADTDPHASRWLWLVKWLLALPHFIVLAFLWIAFTVLSIVAFFAILFTGRYPRAIFDFNVGVLRWSWRVAYYTYGALATDRYPPFTLNEVDDYPTHLQIDYPDHLSRGLVLVKWWLLAIPHYLVVALLVGGGTWVATSNDQWQYVRYSGLVSILVLIAAVILAFTGNYPRPLYDLLLGLNRWVLRVAAYVGLMTDQYPPFRLDMGPHEPDHAIVMTSRSGPPSGSGAVPGAVPGAEQIPQQAWAPQPPGPAPGAGGPAPAPRSGWTPGRVIAVVLGSVLGLSGLGGLAGSAALLIADQGLRDGGFVSVPTQVVSSRGYAVVLGDVRVETAGADSALPERFFGDVRMRVTPTGSSAPVFAGIARESDVAAYLGGVGRTLSGSGSQRDVDVPGGEPAVPPETLDIWAAQSSGQGVQDALWTPQDGRWSAVVMNADGSRGVNADVQFGAELPWLGAAGFAVLVMSLLLLAGGVALIAVGVARASSRSH